MTFDIGVLVYFAGVALTAGVWTAVADPDELVVVGSFFWPFTVVAAVGYGLGKLAKGLTCLLTRKPE